MNAFELSSSRTLVFAICYAAAMCVAQTANAATERVPADYPSIQAAIDAAANGDVVLVDPGIYNERVDFQGKAITVASIAGPESTVIDGGGLGSVVTFGHGESRSATLSGFTVTNGGGFDGSGVRIWNASPTLLGNIITANQGCTGVGIYSYFSSPRIEHNTISNNVVVGCSGAWGVGVYIGGDSDAELVANTIVDNSGADASGAGVALFAAGRPLLLSNIIARNSTMVNGSCGWGGGIAIANFLQARIVNNLIAQNRACSGGAIYWIGPSSSGATALVNNTIADNSGGSLPGIYVSGVGSPNLFINNVFSSATGPVLSCQATSWASAPTLDSNDIYTDDHNPYGGSCANQTGVAGNVSVIPGFTNAAAGDYTLTETSPLVDAGNNAAPYLPATDLAGGPRIASAAGMPDRIDIGAYEVVVLNQPPVADAGLDRTVAAGANCLASVTLTGTAVDADGDPLTYQWSGPFGVMTGASVNVSLPAGVHVMTLTVTDGRGGQDTDTVTITVSDATPPAIALLTATPNVITKTNHEMVTVTIAASATDGCGGTVTCRIVSVSSNEPIAGTGGGDLSPDWEIVGNLTLRLRAERSPKGNGRIYTITVECADAAGNATTSVVTVSVPRK